MRSSSSASVFYLLWRVITELDFSSVISHLKQLEINYQQCPCPWSSLFGHYINLTGELLPKAKPWSPGSRECHTESGDPVDRSMALRGSCRPRAPYWLPMRERAVFAQFALQTIKIIITTAMSLSATHEEKINDQEWGAPSIPFWFLSSGCVCLGSVWTPS